MTNNDYLIGTSFFSLGCLSYMIDSIKNTKNKYLITGSVFFNIGCMFYMKDAIKL